MAVSRLVPSMSRGFLAVRGRINGTFLIVLRRQLNRVGVIKAGHHDVAVLPDRVVWVHIVVVEGIGRDPHFSVAVRVVGRLCRVAVCRVAVAISLDGCATWNIEFKYLNIAYYLVWLSFNTFDDLQSITSALYRSVGREPSVSIYKIYY